MPLRNTLLPSPQSHWSVTHEHLVLGTRRSQRFIDITERVLCCAHLSGVSEGTVTVQSLHSTAAIVINENEPLLLDDLGRVLASWAPADARYSHDDFERRTANMRPDERPNGNAHARAMALQVSATLAVIGTRVQLGRWQRILLAEPDGPRSRQMLVTTAGLLGDWPPESHAKRSDRPALVEEPA